ncbi:MAG: methylmalonyl Co-A mutase-associated GTPase MeaB [Rhodothermales bacterium]|nr:methylmalonyl Co-A mutase-associated GTPase MeaB [Rhodothermales bacterium]MBO6781641.1 methylmalonyl Co-A mutase-associated GTPase MeaB [Rhodothermales bacterium]
MADGLKKRSSELGGPAVTRNPSMKAGSRPRMSVARLLKGLVQRERNALGQALSLVESTRPEDREQAAELLAQCETGGAIRLAISGSPGVGKSTFIDAFGSHLLDSGLKVAVLAVDPSSVRTGGSILGDKTRMPRVASHADAFVRPSPASGHLGGVARYTRPAISVCEHAGYDVVLLETVGVGQSEVAARDLCDFFLLLSLAGAGDELQGIKRGIMEAADAVAITKADGDNTAGAEAAAARLKGAMRLFPPDESGWRPRVMTCSALEGRGLSEVWQTVTDFRAMSGVHWTARRAAQRRLWFRQEVLALRAERDSEEEAALLEVALARVEAGLAHPFSAALRFVDETASR